MAVSCTVFCVVGMVRCCVGRMTCDGDGEALNVQNAAKLCRVTVIAMPWLRLWDSVFQAIQ